MIDSTKNDEESFMKKFILILALLPLQGFAEQAVNPNVYASNNNCSSLLDPKDRKDCLNIEKRVKLNKILIIFKKINKPLIKNNFSICWFG